MADMRRLTPEELRTRIEVQMAVAPRHVLRDLSCGNASRSDPARRALTDLLVARALGGCEVLAPDPTPGHSVPVAMPEAGR
jgi:hypothetical protein